MGRAVSGTVSWTGWVISWTMSRWSMGPVSGNIDHAS
jgi:hypothetical protein